DRTSDSRRCPIITRSRASSKWRMLTWSSPARTANNAASLTRLERSAPDMPGVPRATIVTSTSDAMRLPLVWTLRISMRSSSSGKGTTTWRSKRPGRNSAGSRMSGPVVRRHHHDAFVGFEAVHLGEHLVEGLLALVVAATETGTAFASDRVDL